MRGWRLPLVGKNTVSYIHVKISRLQFQIALPLKLLEKELA